MGRRRKNLSTETHEKGKKKVEKSIEDSNKKKSKKENVVEDKSVNDYDEKKKSGKEYFSRCSPPYFKIVMGELNAIIGKQQRSRINDTPFAKWIDMPALAISSGRIDYFLNKFQADSCSFVVGDDIIIPFKSADFSIVLGLHHSGQPIDLDLKLESKFLTRHFDGKITNANRKAIYEKLLLLARSEEHSDVDDFVRVFILFIFNCIIFPTSNYISPGFIFPYLDDLTIFFKYAWGDAAFRFLYREICQIGRKLYVDGCTVGLMAWLYETVPVLGVRRGLNIYPRLFGWGRSKIPLNAADTESLLKRIDSTQILSIHPFCEEENFLLDKKRVLKQEDGRSEAKRFEKIVMKQNAEIKMLKKRCAELEGGNVRRRIKGKQFVVDKCDNIVEAKENVDKTSNLDDFVDVMVQEVISDLGKENKELEGSYSLNALIDEKEYGTDDVLKKENNNVLGSDSRNISGDESSDDTVGGTSEVERHTVFQSSIVDNVRTRVDRVKKKKESMFVTPPSSTPRRKRKVTKQEFVDVDKKSNTPGKVCMNEFEGRSDFCGHEEAGDEERKLLTEFLARKELDVVVWQDEFMRLSGPIFCHFVFGEPVASEIINVYMRIMQKQSIEHGFEIYCMDTIVQEEVVKKLQEYGKRRMVHQNDYGAFLAKMTSFTMSKLQELGEKVFRRCRYIIFPMNDRWHWFLLVYKRDEGMFKLWNSMHSPFAVGTAKVYTKFLAGAIRHLSGFDIVSEPVLREPCRQQGATLDCGVYTCMWLECLARDTDDIWSYAADVKMEAYRARVAVTILSDENGLLKNKFE